MGDVWPGGNGPQQGALVGVSVPHPRTANCAVWDQDVYGNK